MRAYPDDDDGRVLADLAAHGVDMSLPLMIEFAVLAPDELSANAIADALTEAGYEGQIEYDEGEPDEDGEIDPEDEEFGPSWTVYALVTMVPDYQEIMSHQVTLDRLVTPLGGKCDGWGAMID